MRIIRPLLLFAAALPLLAQSQMTVVLKDGRRQVFNMAEVARIEFGSAPIATPPPPAPAGWLESFKSGKEVSGEAHQGSKTWAFRMKLTSYNPSNGAIVGELTWLSLGSIHRIRGTLSGGHFTFTEAEAIRAGAAHLHADYTMNLTNNGGTGTWIDHVDNSTGDIVIQAR